MTNPAPAPSDPAPLVALRRVGKTFANGVVALDGLDLAVRPGEFLTLLGPSGCGKSTALRIVAGLSEPDCGAVEWSQADAAQRQIGFVFQEPTLMPWASVAANVRTHRRASVPRSIGSAFPASRKPIRASSRAA
jgi:NitT/TauT family transport system ATP-binding protein